MVKKSIKFLWMICSCFVLLFVLPMTVKAGEAVTGGASCEEATEVVFGKEYTTETSDGWFKVYVPENTKYIGIGYDEFTEISTDVDENDGLYIRNHWWFTKLDVNTCWWSLDSRKGSRYYYFNISTSKAENCKFYFACDVYSNNDKTNPQVIQLNKDYQDKRYITEKGAYDNYEKSIAYYQFVAANSGNYKIFLNSKNAGAYMYVTYKDGEYITEIDCENNQQVEEIISVNAGMTYKIKVVLYGEVEGKTGAISTFQVSNAKVSNIALNSNSLTMNKGDQFVLAASVTPENAVDKTITYTSSNPAIATISEEGVVTAVRGGNATITASATDGSGVQAMCSVTVIPKLVNRLEINDEHIEEDLGTFDDELYYYQLKATVYPTDADDTSVTYTSSNRSVVTVDKQSGVLKLKKPGTAIITCKTNDGSNLTKTCKVVLKQSHFKGYRKTIDKIKYKVTSDSTEGGTVVVYGVSNKNMKSYTINNSIIIDGFSYKITGIHDRAFKNCKKATNIVLGTQIKTIGKEAFYNCKKLKSLTIKSKKIKTVGKNAYKNINGKATIKVPSSKLSKYKKLMKDKGQKKSVKIKKM